MSVQKFRNAQQHLKNRKDHVLNWWQIVKSQSFQFDIIGN